jgi:hypothetical protein
VFLSRPVSYVHDPGIILQLSVPPCLCNSLELQTDDMKLMSISSQDIYKSMWKVCEAKSQHYHHSFGPQTLVIGSVYLVAWVLEICVIADEVALGDPSLNP